MILPLMVISFLLFVNNELLLIPTGHILLKSVTSIQYSKYTKVWILVAIYSSMSSDGYFLIIYFSNQGSDFMFIFHEVKL